MNDSLGIASELVASSANWDLVWTVIAAFIGGGIVTLVVDMIRASKRAKTIRRLIKFEIGMNLEVLESQTIKTYPWMTHKTWTSFFDSNSIEITAFRSSDIAEKVLKFYAHMETLRMRDTDDRDVERLQVQGKFDAADRMRHDIGESKAGVRATLIELGKGVLDSK